MNSSKLNKKCVAYLKMKGYIFEKIDTFGDYNFLNNNKYEYLIWYTPAHNIWHDHIWHDPTSHHKNLVDKLNELQQAK